MFSFLSYDFDGSSWSIFRHIESFPKNTRLLLECIVCVIISFTPYCCCLRTVSLSSCDYFYPVFSYFPTLSPPLTNDPVSFPDASKLRFLVLRFIFLYLLHLFLLPFLPVCSDFKRRECPWISIGFQRHAYQGRSRTVCFSIPRD